MIPLPVLTDDQERACAWLVSLARVRASTSTAALPVRTLPRWSTPLLVGPSGSGKAFVCEQVARRLAHVPFRRWDVGSWLIMSNRTSNTTLEQLRTFVESRPTGCVVYLAGIDALAAKVERAMGYYLAMASEIAQFLDWASARPGHLVEQGGKLHHLNVLVVVGGCFAGLWGEQAIGGPGGAEAWRLADGEPLADPAAVARWLQEHSGLPANLLRRLSPEPLVLHRFTAEQAERLAVRLRDSLPPVFDGLSADDLRTALQSGHGWQAVTALLERTWVDGHEPAPVSEASAAALTGQGLLFDLPEADPSLSKRGWRLGERLGIPSTRARLLTKARRLGLRNAWELEDLAIARGYLLPDQGQVQTQVAEKVPRAEFSDVELAAALLSPCLELPERVICRGACMLASLLASVDPAEIVREARHARGLLVVRHVALIGHALDRHSRRWRDLVLALPSTEDESVLDAKEMPDMAIRRVLAAHRLC